MSEILPKYLIATSVLVDGEGSLITGLARVNLCCCVPSEIKRESGEAESRQAPHFDRIMSLLVLPCSCGVQITRCS